MLATVMKKGLATAAPLAMATLLLSAGVPAAAVTPADAEAALVGRWQPDLTAQIRKLPQAAWKGKTGGGILELTADHRLRLYPKCGREKTEWEARGLSYGEGRWELVAPGKLRMVVEQQGKKFEQDAGYVLTGDDLVLSTPSRAHEPYGRFPGEPAARCD